jgi:HAD superfamily hydrolase (TIGR01450 family)
VPQPDFFIDIDGVLCDGPNLIEGGPQSLSFLRSQSSRFLLVTNTTRMSALDIEYKLNDIGYKITGEEIFPVSQATVEYVNSKYGHAHCFLIGDENLDSLFRSHGHTVTRNEEPVDAVVIGQAQWAHFGEIDIARRLVEAGAEPVAMHKDPTWPDGGIIRIGLGPIVAALQSAISGKITLIGKPETAFFEMALTRAGYQRSNTIMIGDSPQTDIAGAISAGLKTLQVRTGNGADTSPKGCDWVLNSIAELPQWYRSNFKN